MMHFLSVRWYIFETIVLSNYQNGILYKKYADGNIGVSNLLRQNYVLP